MEGFLNPSSALALPLAARVTLSRLLHFLNLGFIVCVWKLKTLHGTVM